MRQSLLVKFILPFLQWYALMIIFAIGTDYIFHRLQWLSVGRYLGIAGTLVIGISFSYSLRKRKLIETGSPKQHLLWHEYMAWAGSVMLIVHAGIHFNAILPWLAVLMLLIAVASGLVGKFLLKKANESLKEKRQKLIQEGMGKEETERILFFDSISVNLMKKWRVVHLPITLILGILAGLHILTMLIFSP